MKTYEDIEAAIAELEKQTQAVLDQERAGLISRIKEAIEAYGLTAQDLGLAGHTEASERGTASKRQAAATTAGVPKYRDPQTGKTWTGRGKPPNWIVGAKDREAFLIRPGPDSDKPDATKDGSPGQREATGRGGRRRNAATKPSKAARLAASAPAVQAESGAGSA
jgi:DNA-binding protein H-NS